MEQLFGQIGKFDNYSNTTMLDELKTNIFGENPKNKKADQSEKLRQSLAKVLRQ